MVLTFGPPRYFVPITIMREHGPVGFPSGYLEMTAAMAPAWSPIEAPASVRLMDKMQAILRRTLPKVSEAEKPADGCGRPRCPGGW